MAKNGSKTSHINDQKVLAAQLFIQNNLDGDLLLKSVARAVGVSPAHLHRVFKSRVGETIKKYCDRLRVEKSLYDIRLTELNLLQISLRYGFRNPETYTRVFKRYFGRPPSHFLNDRSIAPANQGIQRSIRLGAVSGSGLRNSKETGFTVTRLQELRVAFIRHTGPYEEVPIFREPGETLWKKLENFATTVLGESKPFFYIGIPHDSPDTTVPDKLRFDGCILVREPFQPQGEIGFQLIRGGFYGVMTHAGPYATLAETYVALFTNATGLRGFSIDPAAPVFELMIDISAASIDDHTWTELYVPLTKKGEIE
ncbi:MAG: helix-turn-helix domain-containing protein [Acidobacteriota bacterium]|nr:helix-turn-helix domain-containing protein [Acidobacteriota bacterium]